MNVEDLVYKLQGLLLQSGVNLLRDVRTDSPTNISITCPIHKDGKESHPSCSILIKDKYVYGKAIPAGTVHCFTCGYSATFDEFLLLFLDGYADVKRFKKGFISTEDKRAAPTLAFNTEDALVSNRTGIDVPIAEFEYYHPYMYKRGLTNDIIDLFDVGFDKRTTSVTFPIKDMHGRVIMIQRRHVSKKKFDNGLNSMKGSVLYGGYELSTTLNQQQINEYPEIWITESPIDALTCWVNNQYAVATLGATITKYQIELIKALPTKKLVLAFDNDDAGSKAVALVSNSVKNKLIYTAVFPEGVKDVNDCPDFSEIQKELYFFCKKY